MMTAQISVPDPWHFSTDPDADPYKIITDLETDQDPDADADADPYQNLQ